MARVKRTVEERVALIDGKIAKKKEEIKQLEAQKKELLKPKTKKLSMRAVNAKIKESGLSAEEVAEKLGLKV